MSFIFMLSDYCMVYVPKVFIQDVLDGLRQNVVKTSAFYCERLQL